MIKQIFTFIIGLIAVNSLSSQTIDSVALKPDTARSCDITYIGGFGTFPNTSYSVDSVNYGDSSMTFFVSSGGIGLPTLKPYTDSGVLGQLPPSQNSVKAYLHYQGGIIDSTATQVSIDSCSITADFQVTDTACQNSQIQLTNKTSSYDSLAWLKDSSYFSSMPNPQTSFSDTGTHSIRLIAIDKANNFSDTLQKMVTVTPIPTVTVTPSSICGGKQDTLTIQEKGYNQYEWKRNGNPLSGEDSSTLIINKSGTYTGMATNQFGCSNTDTAEASSLVNLGPDSSICKGDSLLLDAGNSNATHTWQDNSSGQFYSATSTGTYYVEVDDGSGCKDSDTINLTFNDTPSIELGPDTAICQGSELPLDAGNPGATHVWNGKDTSRYDTFSTTGTYEVKVINSFGCQNTESINIQVNNIAPLDIGPTDTLLCGNDNLVMDAGGNWDKYLWQDSSSSRYDTATSSDNFHVAVTDSNGCQNRDTVQVNTSARPTPNLGNDSTFCKGDSLLLNPGNFSSYLWQDSSVSQTYVAETSGLVMVEVTNSQGCSGQDSLQVVENQNPEVNLIGDTAICNEDSLVLDAGNDGINYNWQDGSSGQVFTVNDSGTYHVEVVNQASCVGRDTTHVDLLKSPQVNLVSDTGICPNDSLTLDAGSNWKTYQWNDGSSNQLFTVNNQGTYYVVVTDSSGCIGGDTANIKGYQKPSPQLGKDTAICESETLSLNAGNDTSYSYNWQDGSSASNYQVDTIEGEYLFWVDVETNKGCQASDSIVVTVNDCNTSMSLSNQSNLKVYPNPVHDQLNIQWPAQIQTQEELAVSLLDLNGQQVKKIKELTDRSHSIQMNVADLAEGSYFLMFKSANTVKVKKVLIR